MASHGHSHGPAAQGPQVAVGTQESIISLLSFVDDSSSQVLNADASTNLKSVLSVGAGILRSDASVDHELIMVINFREPVKIRGVRIQATEAKSDSDAVECSAPKTVKIFLNRPHYSFAECASETATETLQLTPEQVASGEEVRVKFVKFQSVQSLTIFVESNQDDAAVTFLNHIEFVGVPLEATKMQNLKAHEC